MENNEKEHSDDGSYELIDYEEYSGDDVASDMGKENDNSDCSYEFVHSDALEKIPPYVSEEDPTSESEEQSSGAEYSDAETDDGLQMFDFQFSTVAYQKVRGGVLEFPANIKNKRNMEIKDVVKDHALHFLPAKSLIRSRLVSKEWDQWISSPFLAHKQGHNFRKTSGFFRNYYGNPTFIPLDRSAYGVPSPGLRFLPETVAIRSSCDGLLLCQGFKAECTYYICNPANQEWMRTPPPKYYHGDKPKIVLAFEPSTLNFEASYQVVCAIPLPLFEGPIISFEIYNSNTKSWNPSSVCCVELGDSKLKENGFYMNGVSYWETSAGELLAFDMKNEICGIQPLPCGRAGQGGVVSQMDGELCYIQARHEDGNTFKVDIYAGSLMSLKRSLTINLPLMEDIFGDACQVLPTLSSDVLALLINDFVYAYHVRDAKVEVTKVVNDYYVARYFPYVNSLVSVVGK